MPTNKDFKRLVRGRMRKTGEAYTTARAYLLNHPRPRPAAPQPKPAVPAPAEYAGLAGMSDAALKAKTGCTWQRWVHALDYAKAQTWPHRDIAEYVSRKYQLSGWWSQTVTVGYERIKGLRAIGQRRNGTFEANKSRTYAVSVSRLYRAFSDPWTRSLWLPGVALTVRTATKEKSLRITWPDGSSVQAMFSTKGAAKSQVQIQHGKLAEKQAAERLKAFRSERLDALGATLSAARRRSSARPV